MKINIETTIPPDILIRFPVLDVKEKNVNLQVCYDIVKELAPKTIAEIGVRCGYSAWAMLQAAPDATFYGFDNYSYKPRQVCQCASEYLLKDYNTEITEKDTQETKNLCLTDIDLFHVDGDHTYAGAYHDLELAFKTLSENGKILVDDTSVNEVAQACVDFIWVHNEYEVRMLDDFYFGKWLIQLKGSNEQTDKIS